MPQLKYIISDVTDIGAHKTQNEDSYLINKQKLIFIIADGMGGHVKGEEASQIATQTMYSALLEGKETEKAIEMADQAIFDVIQEDKSKFGMGTTSLIAKLKKTGEVKISWIGDSRAYVYNKEGYQCITNDHTYAYQLALSGAINSEELAVHPYRNILTRAVGGEVYGVNVESTVIKIVAGEILLLCTDGLYNEVNEKEIHQILFSDNSSLSLDEKLMQIKLKCLDKKPMDNFTYIAIQSESMENNE